MHLNYIYIQTDNKPTNKESDGYTVILDESKIANGGGWYTNDCSQILNNFTLHEIHKFELSLHYHKMVQAYGDIPYLPQYDSCSQSYTFRKIPTHLPLFNFLGNYTATLLVFRYEWGKNFQSYIVVDVAGNTYIWAILTLMVFIWFCPKYSSFFFWSDTHSSFWIKKN